MRIIALTAFLPVALLLSGCNARLFDVNLFIVGEQTALEQQVLGSYEALGEDLLIYSSVRGVDEDGDLRPPPPATDSQQAAFNALRNREYNADDVQAFLTAGIVGEGRDGLLIWREDPRAIGPLTAAEVREIVDEENGDRAALLSRLFQTTPGATREDEEAIRWIFAGLNQEATPPGAWLQDRTGQWRTK